ncbi:hypothetical protein [uncultured Nostoc sp.]|uniref:hypothetical protein n=1 Tax=uncultured Nostoc sp. TaxID=340711 RepID=UPI0035C99840
MTLIKIQNVVINNSYVAVVRLDNQAISGKKSVSVPLAAPQFLLFQWDTIAENLYYYKCIEFTGQAGITLQDYFTSFNNVIDRSDFRFWILDFFGLSSTYGGWNKSKRRWITR